MSVAIYGIIDFLPAKLAKKKNLNWTHRTSADVSVFKDGGGG